MPRKQGLEMQARILAILQSHDGALGAYAILERLREGGRVAPPTVYRALASLVADGRAHRVESANAYIACRDGSGHRDPEAGPPVLAICDDCGTVKEHSAPAVMRDLTTRLGRGGFVAAEPMIEIRGHCADCAD